jgi:hypothetical protein
VEENMKRLLFGGFIALSFLGLSYAEPLCKDDVDCIAKFANSKDTRYLEYGCDNYKDQSPGNSCILFDELLLLKLKIDTVYLCDKGNSTACLIKIIYNLDEKNRDRVGAKKEVDVFLKKAEQKCEYEEDYMGCMTVYRIYKNLEKPEKAKYYYNKAAVILMKQISTDQRDKQ